MIKSARKLKRALKRGDYCGVVLYAGPSRIDGAPIVAIACRILEASGNAKTGAMRSALAHMATPPQFLRMSGNVPRDT